MTGTDHMTETDHMAGTDHMTKTDHMAWTDHMTKTAHMAGSAHKNVLESGSNQTPNSQANVKHHIPMR